MLRPLPGALDPGAPPEFHTPDDVIAWVRGVEWLVGSDRALILHVTLAGLLTCVATARTRLQHLGPVTTDAIAAEALACDTSAVLAVDVRPKLPPNGVSNVDRRRNLALRNDLAVHGIALLDTVIVTRSGGLSVTGALAFPLGGSTSWLQVHVPPARRIAGDEWTHETAATYPPDAAKVYDLVSRPKLWLADDPGE